MYETYRSLCYTDIFKKWSHAWRSLIVLTKRRFQGLLSIVMREWKRDYRWNQDRSNPVYILKFPT